MQQAIPTRVGPYEIIDRIGSGATGTVYRGVLPALQRVDAVKVLHPHLESDPAAVARFLQEARSAARLKDHNIVTIYHAEAEKAPYYIAMEFLEGGSLAEKTDQGPIPPQEAAGVITGVALGLDHAHRRGVVHRDIKPANIMFDADGTVKITDFGIAYALEPGSGEGSRTIAGTVEYMSPEQAQGGKPDGRSDIYSLGVVAYRMLTERVPFTNPEPLVTMRQIVHDPVPSPRLHNPSLSDATEAALLKCLAKNPAARYRTARDFARALGEGLVPRRASPMWLKLALAATVLAIAVIVVWMVGETTRGRPAKQGRQARGGQTRRGHQAAEQRRAVPDGGPASVVQTPPAPEADSTASPASSGPSTRTVGSRATSRTVGRRGGGSTAQGRRGGRGRRAGGGREGRRGGAGPSQTRTEGREGGGGGEGHVKPGTR